MARAKDLIALLAACAAPLLAVLVGARGPVTATLNLGPNDGRYRYGFDPFAEISDELATRWSGYHPRLALPLTVSGPAAVTFRVARMLPEQAVVDVALGGQPIDRFLCRGGTWHLRRAPLSATRLPALLSFEIDSHDRRNLGLRFDWVRLEALAGGVLRLRGMARWWPVLLVVGLFVVLRASGFSAPAAAGLAAAVGGIEALWALRDPFTLAQVTSHLTPVVLVAGALAAAFFRRRTAGRWAVALFLASYLVKGAGLFHPATFYPDVQNAQRYVFALGEGTGWVSSRSVTAQKAVNAGYPRFIAGKAYAMPYSPLLFMPFTLVPRDRPDWVEDGWRHLGLLSAAAEVLVVFVLAELLFGPSAAVAAALLATLLPPTYSRLLLAMHATLVGHLLDLIVIVAALRYVTRPHERRRMWQLAAATLAALLSYVSSLFNVTGFLGFLAALERRRAAVLLALAAGGAILTVALLYGDFTLLFLREILPALWQGSAAAGPSDPGPSVARVPLFYGFGYPALALAGLVLARRQLSPPAFHVLASHGLTFLLLLALRAFGGGLFKDLKEISFVGPLLAVLGGLTLAEMWGWRRWGRLGAALIVASLVAFTAERYVFYLRAYASPIMTLTGAGSGTFLSGEP